jgi:hypothetical protein
MPPHENTSSHRPDDSSLYPQTAHERLILPQPISSQGTGMPNVEKEMLRRLSPTTVFMMGDNPALPRMPKAP